MFKKYLFLDRDGTLIEEPRDFQIDSYEKFRLLPQVIPSLLTLQRTGYKLVMISNQDGLGTSLYPHEKFDQIQSLLLGILESQGISFEEILICPHTEADRCFCRKPQLGLVREYLSRKDLDRTRSFVIGDRMTDLALAENMGLAGIRITPQNGWTEITRGLLSKPRTGRTERKTKETEISVKVDLDSWATPQVSTGIGFFNHMLEQLCYHGGFAVVIQVKGDLDIDDHHTVEDTGIAMGTALRQALGDKIGIERFGFLLPMDDAQAQVGLDLSGRAYFRFDGKFNREMIGDLASEMIPHFFRSLAESLQANLHIRVEGENSHHQAEAIFKAVGRCLKQACQISKSLEMDELRLPSTKGIL